MAADVATVAALLPRRSTSRPLRPLLARPPRLMPSSVSPNAASEMPRSACTSGNRGVHDDSVAPFTKNMAPMAIAARPLGLAGMAEVTIYHNPRCTKSRQALQVAEELGVEVDVVRYLETPPDEAALRSIIAKLEDPPSDLVRREKWSELGVSADDVATTDGVVGVLVEHPELLQRPLLVTADTAIIGRPTERVGELLQG